MKCDIEAKELGLSDDERALIDEEIKQAKLEDQGLQDVLQKAKKAREDLEALKSDKKDFTNTSKENKDKLKQLAKDSLKEGQSFEDLNKIYSQAKELKKSIGNKKDESEQQSQFKKSINELTSHIRAMRDEAKTIRDHIKQTRSRVIQKALDDNFEGARKTSFAIQNTQNPGLIKYVLNQLKPHFNNLWSVAHKYSRQMLSGIDEYLDGIKGFENDMNHEPTKQFINHIRQSINSSAKALGIEEKYALNKPNEHPVHLSLNTVMQFFFRGFFKAKVLDERVDQFLSEWTNAVGLHEVKRVVHDSYVSSRVDGIVFIPTPEKAVREMVSRYAKGQQQILNFSKMEFLNDEKASAFIKKYSGNSIAGNYFHHLLSMSKKFAASKVAGGYIDDRLIDRNPELSDKEKILLKNYRDLFFGDNIAHSATIQRWVMKLSSLNTLLASARAVTLATSAIGDHVMGKTFVAMKYMPANNLMTRTLEIAKELATGGALKYGFTSKHADNLSQAMKQFHMHNAYRFGDSLGQIPSGLLGKINSGLMNWFENIDSGLRASAAKDYANIIKDHSGYSLNELESANPKLHRALTQDYQIKPDEWEKVKDSVSQHDFLDCTTFKGDLSYKVASMQYAHDLSATPVGVKMPSSLFAASSKDHPIASKLLSMFWAFTTKLAYHSWKVSANNMPLGRFGYFAALMVGGFLPNLAYEYFTGLWQGKSVDDVFNSKETYINALMGPFGRLFSVGSALTNNVSQLGYTLFSPTLSEGYTTSKAIYKWTEAAINQDDYDEAFFQTAKAVMGLLPIFGYTPLRPYILAKFNSDYKPMPGTQLQDWIRHSA